MKRTYVKVISDLIRQRFRILRKKLTYESIIGILTGLVPIFYCGMAASKSRTGD